MKRLQRLLNIKPGEGAPVLILFTYFFFLAAMSIAGKAARDTYFLSRIDNTYLSLMYVGVAIATAITVSVSTRISRRLSMLPLTALSALFFMVTLLLIQLHLAGWVIPFLYVWMEVITTVMFFQFWIVAGTVFNSRQAKRLFGVVASGSPIAGIVIGFGIQPFVGRFSGYLLILASAFILVCVLMVWLSRPHILQSTTVERPTKGLRNKSGVWDGYLKKITLSIGVAAMATTIIDNQFKLISSNSFASEGDLAGFFLLFDALTSIVALFIQFFLTGRILTKFGVVVGLIILPLGLTMGSAAILLSPILVSALVARTSEKVTKFSINDASVQLLWVPITPDRKRVVKPVVDGTIKNSLQGLVGLTIFIFLKFFELQYLSLAALGLITIWIINTFQLRKGYVSTLMSAIEKRQLDFEELRLDITDSNIISTLESTLNSDEEAQQVFGLDLISNLSLEPWRRTLNRLLKDGSFLVQQKILAMAGESPEIIANIDLLVFIHEHGPLTDEAIVIAAQRGMTEIIPPLTRYLENPDSQSPGTVAAAATAILLMDKGPVSLAQDTLEKMLTHPNEALNAISLETLVNAPSLLPDERLHHFLLSDSPQISHAALAIAEKRDSPDLMPAVAANLKHPHTTVLARRILKKYPTAEVARTLITLCNRPDAERSLRLEIIRTLKEYPIKHTVYHFDYKNLPVYAEAVDALLEIARQEQQLLTEVLNRITEEIHVVGKSIYVNYRILDLVGPATDELLLTDLITNEIEKATAVLLKLSVLHVPETPIEQYIYYVQSADIGRIANVVEILDNVIANKESEIITPLVEPASIHERSLAGQRYSDLPENLDTGLVDFIQSPNEWRSVVALDYALRHHRADVLNRLDWERVPASEANRDLIMHHLSYGKALDNLPKFPKERFQLPKDHFQQV